MRPAARITAFVVLAGVGAAIACSDAAKPLGTGDKFINDTVDEDSYSPPPPPPPPTDAPYESGESGYAPALNTCASCSCDPTKNYCFSGGVMKSVRAFPGSSGGGFGEPDGAAMSGPPPPPCTVLDAGTFGNGCIPLPAACMTQPDCNCLITALQPSYSCYLVCTPTPGYLEVYCPSP